jgi:hypothetical protein
MSISKILKRKFSATFSHLSATCANPRYESISGNTKLHKKTLPQQFG